jgi:multiple sugar transport system permease protein
VNKTRDTKQAILFLLPIGILYVLFLFGPMIGCLFLSFTKYDIISPLKIVGMKNFNTIFRSQRILGIYGTTFKITAILIVLHAVLGLLLALCVAGVARRAQPTLRTIVYLPCIITTASVAIAWNYMLNSDFGVFNWLLGLIAVRPVGWLTNRSSVLVAISLFSVWKFVGNAFLFYYIGLSNIPQTYYEAAVIDGAGRLQRFRRITLPMLTPTIFFVIMTLCINTIQIFDEPYFITKGGPGDASRTINLYIYETAYRNYNLGQSSAVALTLFVILLVFTVLQTRLSRKWVTYDR